MPATAVGLLAHLAVTDLAGTGRSRSALAGLLWSDYPEARARANLRLLLTRLPASGREWLTITRDTVAFRCPQWTDVGALDAIPRDRDPDPIAVVDLCAGGSSRWGRR